jgi:hypothetical protein
MLEWFAADCCSEPAANFSFVTNAPWPHPEVANVLRAIRWREYGVLMSGEILENFSWGAHGRAQRMQIAGGNKQNTSTFLQYTHPA